MTAVDCSDVGVSPHPSCDVVDAITGSRTVASSSNSDGSLRRALVIGDLNMLRER